MNKHVLVSYAAHLQRHVPCPDQALPPDTLGNLLHQSFAIAPALRHYVLDDQGHIRKHVAVFIDGNLHTARHDLSLSVPAGTRVSIIQALSGG
jgi:sulfur-carrier protein